MNDEIKLLAKRIETEQPSTIQIAKWITDLISDLKPEPMVLLSPFDKLSTIEDATREEFERLNSRIDKIRQIVNECSNDEERGKLIKEHFEIIDSIAYG